MFSLSSRRHRQTPNREINSPLPRLIGIPVPLAGEWIYDKHERSLTALILLCLKLAISVKG